MFLQFLSGFASDRYQSLKRCTNSASTHPHADGGSRL